MKTQRFEAAEPGSGPPAEDDAGGDGALYNCTCPTDPSTTRYNGTHCELLVGACVSAPCQNNGLCVEAADQSAIHPVSYLLHYA